MYALLLCQVKFVFFSQYLTYLNFLPHYSKRIDPKSELVNKITSATLQSINNNKEGATGSSAASTASQSTSDVNQVIVEGCGLSGVNGTFTKLVGQMYNGAPVYINRVYAMYRNSLSMGPNSWFISVLHGNVSTIGGNDNDRYGSPNNADSMTPPTNGWVPLNDWDGPAPRCQLLNTRETNNDTKTSWLSLHPPQVPLKKCGKCGKPKKRHSYKVAEWDKRKDAQRKCQVCIQ